MNRLATPALFALLASTPALAGRTAHLFTEESQIVPEGDVEWEQWFWAEGHISDVPSIPVTYWVWTAPVMALTPHWEIALPLQLAATPDSVALDSVGVDVRYRIFPRERDDGFQPLVRVSYQQTLAEYEGPPRGIVDLVATYGSPWSVRATANLGARMNLPPLAGSSVAPEVDGTGALGLSVPLTAEIRAAAETYGTLPLSGSSAAGQLYAGPSLAWTHGPAWLTLGSLFGLTSSSHRFMPKVLWAVTF